MANNDRSKKDSAKIYSSTWGAFQKNPTPKAISERNRRAEEAEGYRLLNQAMGGPQLSYLKTHRAAITTIKELKTQSAQYEQTLKQEQARNTQNLLKIYQIKYNNKK